MVNVALILQWATTIATFLEGVVEQVSPIINKVLDRRVTPPPQPMMNPDCQLPRCGDPPYYCPEQQLSQACLQRKIAADNNAFHRRTTLSSNTKDDDNENKDKSSSMSPSTTIMLVFLLVIALAIIGFLWIRFNQKNDNRWNYDGRKSSTWSV